MGGTWDRLWVIVSLDLHFTYAKLARATALVLGGARFVATNPDRLITVGDALLPEAGALVAAVCAATGVEPVVIGKPSPTLSPPCPNSPFFPG